MDLTDTLDFVKRIALEAGEVILRVYGGEIEINEKVDRSPVTQADVDANDVIVNKLRERYPDYAILTEEGVDNEKRLENPYVWIIDPLDGTKEFISKNGEFTVNIGLVHKGEPILGVIYAPTLDEMFFGCKGLGAFHQKAGNSIKISVSDRKEVKDMKLITSRSHSGEKEQEISKYFSSTTSAGSSLKGCLIAKGDADAYFRFGPVNEWDICAMDCILKGAGGLLTDFEGKEMTYNKKDTLIKGLVASNGKNHSELLDIAKDD